MLDPKTVDLNTIHGAWFDNEGNRGVFKLVRVREDDDEDDT